MESLNLSRSNPKMWALFRTLLIALTFLLIAILLWGVGAASPVQADTNTLYVDGKTGSDSSDCRTPGTPCQTVGYATSVIEGGETILVAQGTYTDNLNINISVALLGGYEAGGWTRDLDLYKTILNGNKSGSVISIWTNGVVFDGFTVMNGKVLEGGLGGISINNSSPDIKNTTIVSNTTNSSGGGVYISGGSPTFTNVDIRDNSSDNCCGGMHIGDNATVYISNTTIVSNTANYGGGIAIYSGSVVTIENSTIISNTAIAIAGGNAGGMDVSDSSSTIINSDIRGNSAVGCCGGIRIANNSTVYIHDTMILSNSAGGAGGLNVNSGSVVSIEKSVISNNDAIEAAGGIAVRGGSLIMTNVLITGNETSSNDSNVYVINEGDVTIINNTISDNNPQGAAAVVLESGTFTITNSIMWNNATNLQSDPPCPTCFVVTYSDIE